MTKCSLAIENQLIKFVMLSNKTKQKNKTHGILIDSEKASAKIKIHL